MTLSGLTFTAAETALAAALPNGTDSYIGLLTTLPSARDGTGLVEASTSTGYTRVAHDAWLNFTATIYTHRKNDGAVTLPVLTSALTGIVGWAIWDDPTAGNLLAFGPMTDSGGNEITKDFIATDQPVFADQELFVTLGPVE